MLLGTGICVIAMLLLGFTRNVAAIFTGWDNTAVSLPLQSSSLRV
jgi:solute carrier family 45 protein 1/2/4